MEVATGLIVAGFAYLLGTGNSKVQVGGESVEWHLTHPRARVYDDIVVWPELPVTIKRLVFTHCTFLTLPDLSNTRISSIKFKNCVLPENLPTFPETLVELILDHCVSDETATPNPIILNTLPSSLEKLDVRTTKFNKLPYPLPKNLKDLSVRNCVVVSQIRVETVPIFRSLSLVESYVISNIEEINFHHGLRKLELVGLVLTSVGYIPDSVNRLNLSDNPIEELDGLPTRLKYFYMSNTDLTTLPRLPPNLKILSIKDNMITEIVQFSDNISMIDIRNNQLTRLPQAPLGATIYINNNHFPWEYFEEYIRNNSTVKIIGETNEENRPLSVREPLSSTEWYNMCSSEINVISQDPWNETDDNSNIVIITIAGKDNCYDAKNLQSLLQNKDLSVVKWIERQGQNNNAESHAMGYGFSPDRTSDVYVKLLPEYGTYIKIQDIKNMLYVSTKRYFKTTSLGKHRVGNLIGHYEMSGVHGQGPPFPELFSLEETDIVPSMKVREAPVVRPMETTEQSRRELAERIARSRARQAQLESDPEQ